MMDKEDWEHAKKRWEAWWEHGLHDRVLVQATAPRADVDPRRLPHLPDEDEVDPRTAQSDFDYMIPRMVREVETTYYGGEAVPLFGAGLSVGWSLPFGCEPEFRRGTVWAEPLPVKEDGYPEIVFSEDNPWWRNYLSGAGRAARASRGRYFILPQMGNDAGDTLALIRGGQTLMMDIAEDPEWVASAVAKISDIIMERDREVASVASPEACGIEGNVNDHRCWWSGSARGVNCDISCMVSARTLEEIFLPSLVKTMRCFQRNSYELDGPGAIHNLDVLLDVPELDAIQWIPGDGRREAMQWAPLIRRVQDKGKSLRMTVRPEEIEPMLRDVRPEGLCFSTECETEAEARELVEHVGRLSRQARRPR